jgi:hypothetical protein
MSPNGPVSYGKYDTTMEQLLPCGAWLVGPVEAIKDFDRSGPGLAGFVQALDKDSGEELWSVLVQSGDMDNAPPWLQRFKVKIASAVKPELPPLMPGTPFRQVWFDGLTVIPYVDDKACTGPEPGKRHRCRAKVAYSVRAAAMRAPTTVGRPSPAPTQAGAA